MPKVKPTRHIVVDLEPLQEVQEHSLPLQRLLHLLQGLAQFHEEDFKFTLFCNGGSSSLVVYCRSLIAAHGIPADLKLWWTSTQPGDELERGVERIVAPEIKRTVLVSLDADVVLVPIGPDGGRPSAPADATIYCLLADNQYTTNEATAEHRTWLKTLTPCLYVTEGRVEVDEPCAGDSRDLLCVPLQQLSGSQALQTQILHFLDSVIANHAAAASSQPEGNAKPDLVCVTPLPPEQTGIAAYCAELLPALGRFYNLVVVSDQKRVSNEWIEEYCSLRSVAWFTENGHNYDRVLYHFGNSSYHAFMFPLLRDIPGVVVLHDFFLGDLQRYREGTGLAPCAVSQSLLQGHGCQAFFRDDIAPSANVMADFFPCSFEIFEQASAVIVHSHHALELARTWYPGLDICSWSVIPHLRCITEHRDKQRARRELGFDCQDFVVCSFGVLGASKQNHVLIDAWKNSQLSRNPRCKLLFVGENPTVEYRQKIEHCIGESGCAEQIRVTGWVEYSQFQHYLAAADLAVQLRDRTRGETSGTVLDCMNHAVPVVVNALGSMAELPEDSVRMLPQEWTVAQLTEALETMHRDPALRERIGSRGNEEVRCQHSPKACAEQYAREIERGRRLLAQSPVKLAQRLVAKRELRCTEQQAGGIAQAIAASLPPRVPARRLFIDVSATLRDDLKTGIQRVVKSLTLALLQSPPEGYQVEPVYLCDVGGKWHYRYAHQWALGTLTTAEVSHCFDEAIEVTAYDQVLLLDYNGPLTVAANRAGLFAWLRQQAGGVYAVIYDMLPIQMPHFFPPGQFGFREYLASLVAHVSGFICISSAVADEVRSWLAAEFPSTAPTLPVHWFHLGGDIANSVPSVGIPAEGKALLCRLKEKTTFLMVGTIEPRKGYEQVITAFSQLWEAGVACNLVIVGKEGWGNIPSEQRRSIPKTVKRLRKHPEAGHRLFWIEGASDEYLEHIYQSSACLIVASEGEGFGLPLIEAAHHALPIIARDIPVFREVAGASAFYFPNSTDATLLAQSILDWLQAYHTDSHIRSDGMPWLTWKESAEQLLQVLSLN